MFSKLKKEDSKNVDKKEKKVTTDNILEVFSKDMMNEKKKELSETLQKKDPVLYLSKASGILKFWFFIFLFFWSILFTYWIIQNNESPNKISLLKPICFLFLGKEVANDYDGCTSLSSARQYYDWKFDDLKVQQSEKIISILDRVYSIDNFLFTEDIAFLLEKSSSKLPIVSILSEFNELKDAFEPTKKVYALECNDMSITNKWEVVMSCSSYSSDWSDSNIMWYNWQTTSKKISGTSISVASSFVNFIRKKWENFQVVESSKVYSYWAQLDESKQRYTKRTDFDLTLKYINPLDR